MVFQDPFASLNPRHSPIARSSSRSGITASHAATRPIRASRAPRGRRAASRRRQPLPADFSGGQRQRVGFARLSRSTLARGARRARVRARRLDPGPDRQPPRGAPERARAHVPLHRPRPGGGPPHLRPDRRDVPRQDRRGRARRRPSSRTRTTPTPCRCSPRCPCPTLRSSARGRRSACRATCRALRTPRPRAGSTRAARSSSRRGAATRSRLLRTIDGHLVACHFAERIRAGSIAPAEREPVLDATVDEARVPVPAELPPT